MLLSSAATFSTEVCGTGLHDGALRLASLTPRASHVNAAFANYRREQIGARSSPPTRRCSRRVLTEAQVAALRDADFPLRPLAGLPYIIIPLRRPPGWPDHKTVGSTLSARTLEAFVSANRASRQAVRLRRSHKKRGTGLRELRYVTPVPDGHEFVDVLKATLQCEGLGGLDDARRIRGVQVLESSPGCGIQQYHLDHPRETHRRPVSQRALSVIAAVHEHSASQGSAVRLRLVNERARREELVTVPAGHAIIFRSDAVHSGYSYERKSLRLFAYFFSAAHEAEAFDAAGTQQTHRLSQRDVAALVRSWKGRRRRRGSGGRAAKVRS